MKSFISALIFFSAVSSAAAVDPYARNDSYSNGSNPAVRYYDPEKNANIRPGASCELSINGKSVVDGLCNIGRRDSVTVIETGRKTYRIVRNGKYNAKFYEGIDNFIENVSTVQGSNCWSGDSVSFCAH